MDEPLMTTLDILNCASTGTVDLQTPCPVGWERMQESGCTDQRWCSECGRRVFRCVNSVDTTLRIANDEAVAVPEWLVSGVRAQDSIVILGGIGHPYAHRVGRVIDERVAEGKSVAFVDSPPESDAPA